MVLWWYFHLLQRTLCRSASPTLLVCTAPRLIGGVQGDSINYTIIMDNAPGPSNTGELRLSLAPNPNIATDGLATTDYTVGAGTPIIINVRTTCSALQKQSCYFS